MSGRGGVAALGQARSVHAPLSMPQLAADIVAKVWFRPWHWRAHCAAKRFVDVGLAAVSLVLLAPVLLIVALLIRLETPGPALFVQARWGRGKRKIRVLKFRTMHSAMGDAVGVQQTVPGDRRVTPLGRFLRRHNIDELPQLINVLIGDLSLVGPRCHPVGMQAGGVEYEALVPEYHCRHLVRPGITGLAQVNGLRGPTVDPMRARSRIVHDLRYISTLSILGDLKILWMTVAQEMRGGTGF